MTNFLSLAADLPLGSTKRSTGTALGGKTLLLDLVALSLFISALGVPTRPWTSSAFNMTALAPLSESCQRELRNANVILLDR